MVGTPNVELLLQLLQISQRAGSPSQPLLAFRTLLVLRPHLWAKVLIRRFYLASSRGTSFCVSPFPGGTTASMGPGCTDCSEKIRSSSSPIAACASPPLCRIADFSKPAAAVTSLPTSYVLSWGTLCIARNQPFSSSLCYTYATPELGIAATSHCTAGEMRRCWSDAGEKIIVVYRPINSALKGNFFPSYFKIKILAKLN